MNEGWQRQAVSSGSPLEQEYGYCRAVRIGPVIHVAGTAPIWPDGSVDPDAGIQARRCFEIIVNALAEIGATPSDVARVRVFVTSATVAGAVGRAHRDAFGGAPPAMSMVVVAGLLDPRWLVEIEADAVLADGR